MVIMNCQILFRTQNLYQLTKVEWKKLNPGHLLCISCKTYTKQDTTNDTEKLEIALMRGYKYHLKHYLNMKYYPLCDNCFKRDKPNPCPICGIDTCKSSHNFTYKCKRCEVRICSVEKLNTEISSIAILSVSLLVNDLKDNILNQNDMDELQFNHGLLLTQCLWCERNTCNECNLYVPIGPQYYTFICKPCYVKSRLSIKQLILSFSGVSCKKFHNCIVVGIRNVARWEKYILKEIESKEMNDYAVKWNNYTWYFTQQKPLFQLKRKVETKPVLRKNNIFQ